LECLSLCWHAPLRRDHPGYCTAEVGHPGGTYELPCTNLLFCIPTIRTMYSSLTLEEWLTPHQITACTDHYLVHIWHVEQLSVSLRWLVMLLKHSLQCPDSLLTSIIAEFLHSKHTHLCLKRALDRMRFNAYSTQTINTVRSHAVTLWLSHTVYQLRLSHRLQQHH
jgi:hypothetical protein